MLRDYLVATYEIGFATKPITSSTCAALPWALLAASRFFVVQSELSVDGFHERMALIRSLLRESEATIVTYEDTQGLTAGAALTQIPDVENACRFIERRLGLAHTK